MAGILKDMRSNIAHYEGRQFLLFLIIGGLNSLCSYALFLFAYWFLDWDYVLAFAASSFGWSLVGFELQRRWVFDAQRSMKSFFRYLAAQLVAIGIGATMMFLFVVGFQLKPELSYVFVLGTVAVTLYVISRVIVFEAGGRRAGRESAESIGVVILSNDSKNVQHAPNIPGGQGLQP